MNQIVVEVFSPRGSVGLFGFYTVPRLGEEVRLPGGATGTVKRVVHIADPAKDRNLPPPIQILIS